MVAAEEGGMTVNELIAKLQTIPGDYEVIVLGQGGAEGCEMPADIHASDRERTVLICEESENSMSMEDLLKLTTRPYDAVNPASEPNVLTAADIRRLAKMKSS
jgi:hypothetical protein